MVMTFIYFLVGLVANYFLIHAAVSRAVHESEQTKLLREINAKLGKNKTKIDS